MFPAFSRRFWGYAPAAVSRALQHTEAAHAAELTHLREELAEAEEHLAQLNRRLTQLEAALGKAEAEIAARLQALTGVQHGAVYQELAESSLRRREESHALLTAQIGEQERLLARITEAQDRFGAELGALIRHSQEWLAREVPPPPKEPVRDERPKPRALMRERR